MDENQLKYANFCISMLVDSYPKSHGLKHWMDGKKVEDSQMIIDILESERWIEKDKGWYKLTKPSITIIQKHNSYSNYYKFNTKKEERKDRKETYDYYFSKYRKKTFWIVLILGLFGGIYSIYDFIERLSKPKTTQSQQSPKEETKAKLDKSHTLILDKKSLDSLCNSKTHGDSLKID